MKVVTVSRWRTILLPKLFFKPADKVAIVREGSMLVIKKVETPRLSSLAARTQGRSPSLRDIAREIHSYRRNKRAA